MRCYAGWLQSDCDVTSGSPFAILNRLRPNVEVRISAKELTPEKSHTRVMIGFLFPISFRFSWSEESDLTLDLALGSILLLREVVPWIESFA